MLHCMMLFPNASSSGLISKCANTSHSLCFKFQVILILLATALHTEAVWQLNLWRQHLIFLDGGRLVCTPQLHLSSGRSRSSAKRSQRVVKTFQGSEGCTAQGSSRTHRQQRYLHNCIRISIWKKKQKTTTTKKKTCRHPQSILPVTDSQIRCRWR